MNINKDKEIIELWKEKVGKRVRLWGKDVNSHAMGTYIAKHVDTPLHYVLVDGEENPRVFHIFNIELVIEQIKQQDNGTANKR